MIWMTMVGACTVNVGGPPPPVVGTDPPAEATGPVPEAPFLVGGPYDDDEIHQRVSYSGELLLGWSAEGWSWAGRLPATAPSLEVFELGPAVAAPVLGQAQGRLIAAWASADGDVWVRGVLESGDPLDAVALDAEAVPGTVGLGLAPDGAGITAFSEGDRVVTAAFDRETEAFDQPQAEGVGADGVLASADRGDGTVLAAWLGPALEDPEDELFALRAATLPATGDEVTVDDVDTALTDPRSLAVAVDADRFAVVWAGEDGLYLRVFDGAGPLSAPVLVTIGAPSQTAIALAGDAVALAYVSPTLDFDEPQLHLQLLDLYGQPLHDAILPSASSFVAQQHPSVATRAVNGGYELALAWSVQPTAEVWAQTLFWPTP